jgi:hypothetical protein
MRNIAHQCVINASDCSFTFYKAELICGKKNFVYETNVIEGDC